MKRIMNNWILTLVLIGCHTTYAADWLNWSNYSKITAMVQRGNELWVGGHGGLSKIDLTSHQEVYFGKKQGKLPSLMVEDLALAINGTDIWIGTYDNGLVRYSNGTMTVYPYPQGVALYHIAVTPDGAVWCATDAGVYKFSNQTFTYVPVNFVGSSWDIKAFPNGKLLIGASKPVVYDPATDSSYSPNTSIFAYMRSTVEVKDDTSYYFSANLNGTIVGNMIYVHDTTVVPISDTLISSEVVQLKRLHNGHLLALTAASDLYSFDGSVWSFDSHQASSKSLNTGYVMETMSNDILLGGYTDGGHVKAVTPGMFLDISLKRFGILENQIHLMKQKSPTEIWVTGGNQIGIYNTASRMFTQIDSIVPSASNIGDIVNWNGTYVAATYNGAYQWTGSGWSPLSISGLPAVHIMSAATDTSGALYLGTASGLYIVKGTSITHFGDSNTVVFSNNNDLIRSVYFDQIHNEVWMATVHGAVKYSNGNLSIYNSTTHPQGFNNDYISMVTGDPQGNVWFGCAYGYMTQYNGTTFTLDMLPINLGNMYISDMAFDGGKMYVTENVNGFWIKENGAWVNYNAGNSDMTASSYAHLLVDPNHNVWVAAQNYGSQAAFGIDIYNEQQVVLGIDQVNGSGAKRLSAYPNPTKGKLTINADGQGEGDKVVITDMLGRQLGTYAIVDHSIDVTLLPADIYCLSIPAVSSGIIRFIKE
jgi:ligand-binding sensor domain-containing protein